ncbi:hypothetical protein LXL04_000297 [Taraxacum kok-saghyz]
MKSAMKSALIVLICCCSTKRKRSSGQKRTTKSKSSYEEKLDVVLDALSTKSTQTFPQNTSFPTLADCMPIVSSFPGFEEEKYYVVDAGYPNTRGYLALYKGATIRYHLPDFQRAQTPALRAPSGAKETFNFRHSSLRNIIERTFGVWKARWTILRDMHVNFTYDDQVKIVLASMAMHNYIRKAGIIDEAFNTAQQESYEPNTLLKSFYKSYKLISSFPKRTFRFKKLSQTPS